MLDLLPLDDALLVVDHVFQVKDGHGVLRWAVRLHVLGQEMVDFGLRLEPGAEFSHWHAHVWSCFHFLRDLVRMLRNYLMCDRDLHMSF